MIVADDNNIMINVFDVEYHFVIIMMQLNNYNDQHDDDHDFFIGATIGASFLSKIIKYDESSIPIKLNIWDTAGQEKYRSLAALYYRGVDCAVIVYDITSRVSFDQVKEYWIHELRHQCFGTEGLQIAIIGNKAGINLC